MLIPFFTMAPLDFDEERQRLERAYDALAGDELALARVSRGLAWLYLLDARSESMIANLERALGHARRSGSARESTTPCTCCR